jgi:hypothetical protein
MLSKVPPFYQMLCDENLQTPYHLIENIILIQIYQNDIKSLNTVIQFPNDELLIL